MAKTNKSTQLDNWDDFSSDYLTATHLLTLGPEGKFDVTGVEVKPVTKNVKGKDVDMFQLELSVKLSDESEKTYTPNWTNTKFIKNNVATPKDLIGKSLSYKIVKVLFNGEYVDSISLTAIN